MRRADFCRPTTAAMMPPAPNHASSQAAGRICTTNDKGFTHTSWEKDVPMLRRRMLEAKPEETTT